MSSPRVHVAPTPDPEIVDAVRVGGGVVVDDPGDAEALVWLAGADGLAERLAPGVRWVQLPWAGVEHVLERGLITADDERVWTSAVGSYGWIVAEHALALILAGLRRLPECARARSWDESLQGRPLRGSTVAIVGAGGIGRELIGLLEPFGVTVVAVTRRGAPAVPGAAETLPASQLDEVWPRADVVVLAGPSTPETRHQLDAAALRALPAHAVLVNVGRGSLVDTDALVAALAAGEIACAALEVTDPEPLTDGHPLWSEPRALITPHVGNPDASAQTALAERVRENVERFAAGRELVGLVDPARGY